MTLVVIIINSNMITSYELFMYAHKLTCIVGHLGDNNMVTYVLSDVLSVRSPSSLPSRMIFLP